MNRDDRLTGMMPNETAEGRDNAVAPELLADLMAVAGIEPAAIDCVAQAIGNAAGMLTGPQILAMVQECFAQADDATVPAVARLIMNLSTEAKNELLDELDAWRVGSEASKGLVSDELFAKMRRNLDVLIQDSPATQLLHKSRRLQRDTGNELYSVKCICDVRPVFDDEHSCVEGFVSLVNLQLGYQKQNQQFETLELTLTEEELQWIVDKANDALGKLRILQDTISDSGDEGESQ